MSTVIPAESPGLQSNQLVDIRSPVAPVRQPDSVTTAINLLFALAKAASDWTAVDPAKVRVLREHGPLQGEPLTERVTVTMDRFVIGFGQLPPEVELKSISIPRANPGAIEVEFGAFDNKYFRSNVQPLLPDAVQLNAIKDGKLIVSIDGGPGKALCSIRHIDAPYALHTDGTFYPVAPRIRLTFLPRPAGTSEGLETVFAETISAAAPKVGKFLVIAANVRGEMMGPADLDTPEARLRFQQQRSVADARDVRRLDVIEQPHPKNYSSIVYPPLFRMRETQ